MHGFLHHIKPWLVQHVVDAQLGEAVQDARMLYVFKGTEHQIPGGDQNTQKLVFDGDVSMITVFTKRAIQTALTSEESEENSIDSPQNCSDFSSMKKLWDCADCEIIVKKYILDIYLVEQKEKCHFFLRIEEFILRHPYYGCQLPFTPLYCMELARVKYRCWCLWNKEKKKVAGENTSRGVGDLSISASLKVTKTPQAQLNADNSSLNNQKDGRDQKFHSGRLLARITDETTSKMGELICKELPVTAGKAQLGDKDVRCLQMAEKQQVSSVQVDDEICPSQATPQIRSNTDTELSADVLLLAELCSLNDPGPSFNHDAESSCSHNPQAICNCDPQSSCNHDPQASCSHVPQASSSHDPQTSSNHDPQASCSHDPQLSCSQCSHDNCSHSTQPVCSHDPQPSCIHVSPASCNHVSLASSVHDSHPSCTLQPVCSHQSFRWSSVQHQSLDKICEDTSTSHSSKIQQFGPTERSREKNRVKQGVDDILISLKNNTSDMNSSIEELRLSMPEADEQVKASVGEPNETFSSEYGTKDEISNRRLRLSAGEVKQTEKGCIHDENKALTVENNCAASLTVSASEGEPIKDCSLENNTSAQVGPSLIFGDLDVESSSENGKKYMVPTKGDNKSKSSLDNSSESTHRCYVFERWTCQSGDIELLDSVQKLADLDGCRLADAGCPKVQNNVGSSSDQSREDVVVHSTQACGNSSESQAKLPVLGLSPMIEDTSRVSHVISKDDVMSDKCQQNAWTVTEDAKGSTEDVVVMTKDWTSTDDVIVISDSNESSAGDKVIIISSSSETDKTRSFDRSGNHELLPCVTSSEDNAKEQSGEKLAAVSHQATRGPIEANNELALPLTVDQLDEECQGVLRNTALSQNKSRDLKSSEEVGQTEKCRGKSKMAKMRVARSKGKSAKSTDLFKAFFPRMPGSEEDNTDDVRALFKNVQRSKSSNKTNQSGHRQKRKLFNTNAVLEPESPVMQKEWQSTNSSSSLTEFNGGVGKLGANSQTSSVLGVNDCPPAATKQDASRGSGDVTSSLFSSDNSKSSSELDARKDVGKNCVCYDAARQSNNPVRSSQSSQSGSVTAIQELLRSEGMVLGAESTLYSAAFSPEVRQFVNDYIKNTHDL